MCFMIELDRLWGRRINDPKSYVSRRLVPLGGSTELDGHWGEGSDKILHTSSPGMEVGSGGKVIKTILKEWWHALIVYASIMTRQRPMIRATGWGSEQ